MRTHYPIGVAFLLLVPPVVGHAQDDVGPVEAGMGVLVRGVVTDQVSGDVLSSVHVTLTRVDPAGIPSAPVWEGLTDATGAFTAGRVPLGEYEVRADALTFSNVVHTLDLVDTGRVRIQVEMVPAAIPLDPIVVTAFSRSRMEEGGFYERRAAGWGYTLTREEIEGRNPSRVSDLFVGIAGARLIRHPPEPPQVRLRNNCVPRVVLNGNPFAFPIRLDALVQPHDVEGIEVYHGSAGPAQFMDYSCGTIMIWTRETQGLDGNPWSWKRLLVGVGLFSLTVLTAVH